MSQRAFTLVEMTLVLLIIAIVTAAVTLRIRGPLRHARQQDVVEMIAQFDYDTRVAAREQDRSLRLLVDTEAGEFRRADSQGKAVPSVPLQLPDTSRVVKLLIRGEEAGSSVGMIPCSPQGLTPSYALLLDSGGVQKWLLVAGLTGAVVEVEDEREAVQALEVADRRTDPR